MGEVSYSSATAINSTNIGFQLLKKSGWKEGTGLGASEQVDSSYMEQPVIMGDGFGVRGLTSINSSNIGFQLLKKCGWKEGTGLGVSEQGMLEPIEGHIKNNKSGIGLVKVNNKLMQHPASKGKRQTEPLETQRQTKIASRRMKKMLEEEKRSQEKELEIAFFREFWPDNV
ncbi:hypothetical protein MKX01_004868 [Papaver californicum]|nr:hypothetical protein MKX01_004868 [Papaver californicum]